MIVWAYLSLLAFFVTPSQELGLPAGKIGKLNLIAIHVKSGILNIQMKRNKDNWKVFDAQLNLTEDYTDKWTFDLAVQKRTGPEKGMNVMQYKGGLCKFYSASAKKAVQKIYGMAVPKVSGNCKIKKGIYTIKDCNIVESDITLKGVPYGPYLLIMKILNPKGDTKSHFEVHVDSLAK